MLKKILPAVFLLTTLMYPQTDLNNRFMLANSYEQAGEYEKAGSIMEELYRKQPDNYQFFDALNRIYLQLKKYDESVLIINSRITSNPDDLNLYGMLGKTYHLKGETSKAFEIWDTALEKGNNNFMVYRIVANYAIDRREFGKAIEVLEQGRDRAQDHVMFSYDLANLYSLTMNYQAAAEEYIYILKKVPQDAGSVRERINSYISKPEALGKTITVFQASRNSSPEIKSVLAWLYTQGKKYDEAYKIYAELDGERGSAGSDIFNFAQQLYNSGEYERASGIFSDLISGNTAPALINASKLGYAKSIEAMLAEQDYRKSGSWKPLRKSSALKSAETDKLLETYLDLSGRTSNSELSNEAAHRAAGIYIYIQNDPGKAEVLLWKIIDNYPVSAFAAPAGIDLGNIYTRQGNLAAAEAILLRVLQLPRGKEEEKNRARLMLGEIQFYRKDLEGAQRYFSEVLANLRDNSANDALQLSFLLNTRMNDSLSLLKFAEAEFLKEQEKFEAAREIYVSISEENAGFMVGGLSRLREAEIELALDNSSRAVEILTVISEEKSRNIYSDKALYLLGNIFEYSLGDSKKAVETYEKLLARFPGSMYLDEAREHLLNLKGRVS